MPELPTVYTFATEYAVSAVPPDHPHIPLHRHFTIKVQWRGGDRWAVIHGGDVLGDDGQWDYEPTVSEREVDWLWRHRYSQREALDLARHWAPLVTVNGRTAAQAIEWMARS